MATNFRIGDKYKPIQKRRLTRKPPSSPAAVPQIQGLSDPGSGVHQTRAVRVVTFAVTAPPVLACVRANARADGVGPDIGDRGRELAFVSDPLGLKRSLVQVAATRVPVVEVPDVGA